MIVSIAFCVLIAGLIVYLFVDLYKPPCKHEWVLARKHYTSPISREIMLKGADVRLAERIMYGFTTFTMRCKHCGKLEHKEVTGQIE